MEYKPILLSDEDRAFIYFGELNARRITDAFCVPEHLLVRDLNRSAFNHSLDQFMYCLPKVRFRTFKRLPRKERKRLQKKHIVGRRLAIIIDL